MGGLEGGAGKVDEEMEVEEGTTAGATAAGPSV